MRYTPDVGYIEELHVQGQGKRVTQFLLLKELRTFLVEVPCCYTIECGNYRELTRCMGATRNTTHLLGATDRGLHISFSGARVRATHFYLQLHETIHLCIDAIGRYTPGLGATSLRRASITPIAIHAIKSYHRAVDGISWLGF